MSARTGWIALASGVLFALGLGISGMTQPAKVLAFLDVSGAWDPTLAFVMLGAIGVHVAFARRAKRSDARPLLAARFELPTESGVDLRLLGGAALFGVGWGIAGFCPGPALVSLVALSPGTLLFVAAMVAGMLLHALVFAPRATGTRPGAPTEATAESQAEAPSDSAG